MTRQQVAEFRELGGTSADLLYDSNKGYVKFLDKPVADDEPMEKNQVEKPPPKGQPRPEEEKRNEEPPKQVAAKEAPAHEEVEEPPAEEPVAQEPPAEYKLPAAEEGLPREDVQVERPAEELPWNDGADDVCDVCGLPTVNSDGEAMEDVLICETCDCEVHLACSGLKVVPKGSWTCGVCVQAQSRGATRAAAPGNAEGQLTSRCLVCGRPGNADRELIFCDAPDCFGVYHLACVVDETIKCPRCRAQTRPEVRASRVTLKEDVDLVERARLHAVVLGVAGDLSPDLARACIEEYVLSPPVKGPRRRGPPSPAAHVLPRRDDVVRSPAPIDVDNDVPSHEPLDDHPMDIPDSPSARPRVDDDPSPEESDSVRQRDSPGKSEKPVDTSAPRRETTPRAAHEKQQEETPTEQPGKDGEKEMPFADESCYRVIDRWWHKRDKKSGFYFYVHELSGDTQWVRAPFVFSDFAPPG